jgi:hypothetical protein
MTELTLAQIGIWARLHGLTHDEAKRDLEKRLSRGEQLPHALREIKTVNTGDFKEEMFGPMTSGWGSNTEQPRPYIHTFMGKAYYSHTETENKYGSWNDRWQTIHGEFVIHEGNKHHVYLIKPYSLR